MAKQSKCVQDEEQHHHDHDHVEQSLFKSAELFLQWLNPTELSSISSTCKTLYHIANSINFTRSLDASRTIENHPIPFINSIDSHPYAFFIYTPTQTQTQTQTRIRQPWGSIARFSLGFHSPEEDLTVDDACGCDCERCDGDGGDSLCMCLGFNLDELTRECGRSCMCELECGNRASQRGISVRLKVVKCKGKGWGLFADQFIRRGEFVCEYAGELLTTKEARLRQKSYDELSSTGRFSSALLVVREHLPSRKACMRINIDATRIGNVGRFINHSCDGGNLSSVSVRSSGAFLPRLCFFASKDIQQDEELTFSYGETRLTPNGLQCFCGASCCLGILPSEHT